MQRRVGNVRWGIAILLAVGIIIDYFDRVNLSVGSKDIIKEFHFTGTAPGTLVA